MNKRKLVILVDMDDVLNELVKHWTLSLNNLYGTNVKSEEIIEWDIMQYFPNLTESQIFSPLKTEEFWINMTAVDDAKKYLEILKYDGHSINVVTATHYGTVKPKIKWLLKTFPMLDWKDVIITSKKYLINGDILIDDGIHNLAEGNYKKILFDRPHNHNFNETEIGAIRVGSWKEIYDVVNYYAHNKEVM